MSRNQNPVHAALLGLSKPRTSHTSAGKSSQAKRKKPKRHQVSVGDLVLFRTPVSYMFGVLGEVTHVLDGGNVVARCLAGDEDYGTPLVVLRTAKPQGKLPSGEERANYTSYITKVVSRTTPLPPKPPRKIVPPKVIETQQALLEHLQSDSQERVVVRLPDQEGPA